MKRLTAAWVRKAEADLALVQFAGNARAPLRDLLPLPFPVLGWQTEWAAQGLLRLLLPANGYPVFAKMTSSRGVVKSGTNAGGGRTQSKPHYLYEMVRAGSHMLTVLP
jgi:hypothetical protein